MKIIRNKDFSGERPLFGLKDLRLENVRILEGESGIKCCENIEADYCEFIGKYPCWHVDGSLLTSCHFHVTSRSAVWYSNNVVMRDTIIDAPKLFREMHDLSLENVVINDADETFWRVNHIMVKNLTLRGGTYPFMFCNDVYVDGLDSDSFYVFQYCKNVEVHNAKIITRDAFWECEDVVVYDSILDGEYIGWHSKNIHLVRCHIAGEQPLCYVDGLFLEDCTFDADSDRIFEDTTGINAQIRGHITNIKNPVSGTIIADSIGSITYDKYVKAPNNCVITEKK